MADPKTAPSDLDTFHAVKDILEEIAKRMDVTPQGQKMRAEVEARIAPYNASLDYWRQQQKPYLTQEVGNIVGWTNTEYPFSEYVGVPPKGIIRGQPSDTELADVIAHEGGHYQRSAAGVVGKADAAKAQLLLKKMQAQKTYPIPENAAGTEEILASMKGIEGRLLKGTSITATPEFEKMTQEEKNFYFGETSDPFRGVWEGQTKQSLKAMQNPLYIGNFIDVPSTVKGVANKAKAVQDWLQQQIGKVIGTR